MTQNSCILLIDDDRVLQRILGKVLQDQGCRVLSAQDGPSGLELARDHQPQLVLCDWCMAGMDGLEVCRQFKQDPALASIFFILLTSRSALEDRVRGLDAGADDFLTKPVEPSELLARVRSGLRLFRANRDLLALSMDLAAQKQKLEEELSSAADYVSSILPTGLSGDVRIESLFRPSQQLGGDCLDYYWLDENRLVLYVLDVSGHGLAAALPSISVHNLLRSHVLSEQVLGDPAAVLEYLNRCFQMGRQHEQYFTLWYGIYDRSQGQLSYSSAGHPPAFLFSPAAEHQCSLRELKAPGLPIGLFEEAPYKTQVCRIEQGALLCVFSDGLYEIPTVSGPMWSYEAFRALLKDQVEQGSFTLESVMTAIREATGSQDFPDDASLIAAHFTT